MKFEIMELFFARPEDIAGEVINLDEFEQKHLVQTLRKSAGSAVHVTDGEGNLFVTRLVETRPRARLTIVSREQQQRIGPRIGMAVGFIRPNRLDFILEKGTELGVDEFFLVRSIHSNYASNNMNRYYKILRQALKQSNRFYIPRIIFPADVRHLAESTRNYAQRIVAVSAGYSSLLNSLRRPAELSSHSLLIAIGPEGGFSDQELHIFEQDHFDPVSLGTARLRSETAAISAIAAAQQFFSS